MTTNSEKALAHAALAEELAEDLDNLHRMPTPDHREIARLAARCRTRLKLAQVFVGLAYLELDGLGIPDLDDGAVHRPTPLDLHLRDERFGVVPKQRGPR